MATHQHCCKARQSKARRWQCGNIDDAHCKCKEPFHRLMVPSKERILPTTTCTCRRAERWPAGRTREGAAGAPPGFGWSRILLCWSRPAAAFSQGRQSRRVAGRWGHSLSCVRHYLPAQSEEHRQWPSKLRRACSSRAMQQHTSHKSMAALRLELQSWSPSKHVYTAAGGHAGG